MATTAGTFGTGGTSAAAGTGGASGVFPVADQTDAVASPATLAALNQNISSAEFMAMTGVTSTELATYQTDGKLNQSAYELVQYFSMSPEERQTVQQNLVDAGLLSASSVSGMASTSLSAMKTAINNAKRNGTPVNQYLNAVSAEGIGAADQTALQETQAATKSLENPAAITENYENPTTLQATQEAAWNTILGYSPNPQQIQQFESAIHAQDFQAANAGNAATKQNDEQILATAKQANTSLEQMGPEGVTLFASLYQKALGGPSVGPGAVAPTATPAVPGTTGATNPPTSTPTTPGAPGSVSQAEIAANAQRSAREGASGLAQANAPHMNPLTGPTPAPGQQPGMAPSTPLETATPAPHIGGGGNPITAIAHGVGDVGSAIANWISAPDPTLVTNEARRVLQTHARQPGVNAEGGATGLGSAATPGVTPSPAAISHVGSGMYMLTPALWAAAIASLHNPAITISKYPTEASAPIATQQSAFANYSTNLFNELGSWSAVTGVLASGTPGGTPTGSQAKIAASINTQINTDIQNIQNELNNEPVVNVKETAPDATAEAAAAAKESDPIGYTAGNISSAAAVMQSMIYGNPIAELQPNASTFTGPVSLGGPPPASTSTPAAPAAAPAPAATPATTGS